jgi:protease IV
LQKSLKISNFKEKLAAFSMKTTDSKDLAKVNQILPIMQEYFGKSMNLARIKLMAYMLHALCVVQTVSLHKLADLGNIARPLNAEEKALIQQSVNNGYELFTRRCAEGRNMPIEDLKKIAEGRVWTGAMAKELKLVDELGNLQTALKAASQHAKIENYNVVAYPKPEDFLTTLMKTRKDSYIQSQVEATFGDFSKGFTLLKNLNKADRLQTRIPFELSIQ